ncbi:MAG: DUF3795 domain-containing protein [Desulfobacteraceae bacterium]|nr:DUF3795 domain-containing protein [Desulfobacteraceae bacterium]
MTGGIINPTTQNSPKIAYCGLDCHQCGAFIANRDNDDRVRAETAADWSKLFKVTIDPKDVNCTGCKSTDILFNHCRVCEIRKCGMAKGIENCAFCDEFPCATVEGVLKAAPEARENLENCRV